MEKWRTFFINTYLFFLAAKDISIDHEGILDVSGQGWGPGLGPSPGIDHGQGGSGASHGGRGGMSQFVNHATAAYGDALEPSSYGSGGSTDSNSGTSVSLKVVV